MVPVPLEGASGQQSVGVLGKHIWNSNRPVCRYTTRNIRVDERRKRDNKRNRQKNAKVSNSCSAYPKSNGRSQNKKNPRDDEVILPALNPQQNGRALQEIEWSHRVSETHDHEG